MKAPLPFVWTSGLRRAYHRMAELARGGLDSTIIYGTSGAGKSEILKKFTADWAWEDPAEYYVKKIFERTWRFDYEFGVAIEFMESIGLADEQSRDEAVRLLAQRFRAEQTKLASALTLWGWFQWVAQRLNRPIPGALACLRLWGIKEPVRGRYPILIRAMVGDRPKDLEIKILQELDQAPEGGERMTNRRFRLIKILQQMPVLILLDEADMLKEDCLHSVRQLCDETDTPFVLAGTPLLGSRLQADPRLKPLATRIGTHIELGQVTLADLKGALSNLDLRIVKAIWQAGMGQFRTISLILLALQRFQQEQPQRRLTLKVVALAAAQVLAARPVVPREDEEEDCGAEAAALPVTKVARASQRGNPSVVALRKAAQAVG